MEYIDFTDPIDDGGSFDPGETHEGNPNCELLRLAQGVQSLAERQADVVCALLRRIDALERAPPRRPQPLLRQRSVLTDAASGVSVSLPAGTTFLPPPPTLRFDAMGLDCPHVVAALSDCTPSAFQRAAVSVAAQCPHHDLLLCAPRGHGGRTAALAVAISALGQTLVVAAAQSHAHTHKLNAWLGWGERGDNSVVVVSSVAEVQDVGAFHAVVVVGVYEMDDALERCLADCPRRPRVIIVSCVTTTPRLLREGHYCVVTAPPQRGVVRTVATGSLVSVLVSLGALGHARVVVLTSGGRVGALHASLIHSVWPTGCLPPHIRTLTGHGDADCLLQNVKGRMVVVITAPSGPTLGADWPEAVVIVDPLPDGGGNLRRPAWVANADAYEMR